VHAPLQADEWQDLKDYLSALVSEQVNRIVRLKSMIPLPAKSPYSNQLAERCARLLDEKATELKSLMGQLTGSNSDFRRIHRKIRMIVKDISVVEYYGISSLQYQSSEVDFLNAIVFKVSDEISLPITPPSVSCLSTDYFYFEPMTRVIYLPLAESDFLLHMPDIYHEIGHSVLIASSEDFPAPRLGLILGGMDLVNSKIGGYFRALILEQSNRAGPREIPLILSRVYNNWKGWLSEFLSDLFATFTLGPAFAWAHLHLVAKTAEDIYQTSWLSTESHPANEARMRLMLHGLRLTGFGREADEILTRWREMTTGLDQPDAYYSHAYPDSLLEEIARTFLAALKAAGIVIASPEMLRDPDESETVRVLLNKAWAVFWSPESDYRNWEVLQIEKLKRRMRTEDHKIASITES
jgi:hypothetical protein